MSVLQSGFTTHKHSDFYHKLLDKALLILTQKLMQVLTQNKKLMGEGDADFKFIKHFRKIQKYLVHMDKAKEAGPKFGHTLEPFC